jgi:hypothetical protein
MVALRAPIQANVSRMRVEVGQRAQQPGLA